MEILALIASVLAIGQFVYLLFRYFKNKKEVRIYENSSISDEDMYRDLVSASSISFYGLEMNSLPAILEKTFDFQGNRNILSINAYYANLEDGKIWLGEEFRPSVLESIKNLAILISSASIKTKGKSGVMIRTYIQTHHTTYAGCSIDDKIIYLVNFSSDEDVNRKDGITLRLHNNSAGKLESKLFKAYANSHKQIKRKAIGFTNLRSSIWDDSAIPWKSFSENCEAHLANMRKTVSLLDLRSNLNILEVACGNGILGKLILEERKDVKLYLTDNSGQMIKSSGHTINHQKAELLYFDPIENCHNWKMFFPEAIVFQRIISHLSFPFAQMKSSDFERLVDFFHYALSSDGFIVLSIHNTAVEIEGDQYDKDIDDFRNTLIDAFREEFGRSVLRELKSRKINKADLVEFFSQKNLIQMNEGEVAEYPFTMHDRVRMWSTPAVLNSLFDMSKCDLDKVKAIMEKMLRKFRNKNTLPMKTITYCFKKV